MRQDLHEAFASLSPTAKVSFLLRVAHAQTIYARDAYAASYDKPDGIHLRTANEFIHRLLGVVMGFMDGRAERPAESIVDAIVGALKRYGPGVEAQLETWIEDTRARDATLRGANN
jgi:hypothetical protein